MWAWRKDGWKMKIKSEICLNQITLFCGERDAGEIQKWSKIMRSWVKFRFIFQLSSLIVCDNSRSFTNCTFSLVRSTRCSLALKSLIENLCEKMQKKIMSISCEASPCVSRTFFFFCEFSNKVCNFNFPWWTFHHRNNIISPPSSGSNKFSFQFFNCRKRGRAALARAGRPGVERKKSGRVLRNRVAKMELNFEVFYGDDTLSEGCVEIFRGEIFIVLNDFLSRTGKTAAK